MSEPLGELDANAPVTDPPHTAAAIDLGSNSFHMIVARIVDGRLHTLDRLKETVRLASGLDANHELSEAARARALAALQRLGERVRNMPRGSVRAVGTNTLRKARDSARFLAEARAALGHPIEIISGIEEARLIYLGVSHGLADDGGRRLVVDIGGGSTELIIGRHFEPTHLESLHMGCVGMTDGQFADGKFSEARWRRATLEARLQLRPVAHQLRRVGWDTAIGASGTLLAIAGVAREMGWSEAGITPAALKKMRKAILKAGNVKKLSLPGLGKDRTPVFAGGVAILQALFEALRIEHMSVSEGALREGLLYDLLGRIRHDDVRDRTVDGMLERFRIEAEHTRAVSATALALFERVAQAWGLEPEAADILDWGARLHEIGLAVAHSQYHKHGAYIIENADLPGFSRQEQKTLAMLVRAHRRKFSAQLFQQLPDGDGAALERLAVLLRMAVLLHRTRDNNALPVARVEVRADALHLAFEPGALAEHPLMRADLESESAYLRAAGFTLTFE